MACQHHPVPVYFSLVEEDVLFLTQHSLRVMAYTVPRSSVQTVTRTAGIQFSRCGESICGPLISLLHRTWVKTEPSQKNFL